jgi:hypothetical protein
MTQIRKDIADALAGDPTPAPPPAIKKGDAMLLKAPSGSWWLLSGGHIASLTAQTAQNGIAGDVPAFACDAASWENITRTYPPVHATSAAALLDREES